MSPDTMPPSASIGQRTASQLEIELLPSGMTIVKECPDLIDWPANWDDDFYAGDLGMELALALGDEYSYRIQVWRPGGNSKTGGKILPVDRYSAWLGAPLGQRHGDRARVRS